MVRDITACARASLAGTYAINSVRADSYRDRHEDRHDGAPFQPFALDDGVIVKACRLETPLTDRGKHAAVDLVPNSTQHAGLGDSPGHVQPQFDYGKVLAFGNRHAR